VSIGANIILTRIGRRMAPWYDAKMAAG